MAEFNTPKHQLFIQNKLQIWGRAKRAAARGSKSDWGDNLGG